MNLALAIVFLWVGGALLYVAFHGLKDVESAAGAPRDILAELRSTMQKQPNAYRASGTGG